MAASAPADDGLDANAALLEALSALDRAAKAGAIHPNAAARRKSRLTRKVNAAVGGAHVQVGSRVVKTTGKAAAAKAAKARIAAGKADKAKGAQTAAGKARAALSKTARAEAAAAKEAAALAAADATTAPAKASATKAPAKTAAKKPAAKATAAPKKATTAKAATAKAADRPRRRPPPRRRRPTPSSRGPTTRSRRRPDRRSGRFDLTAPDGRTRRAASISGDRRHRVGLAGRGLRAGDPVEHGPAHAAARRSARTPSPRCGTARSSRSRVNVDASTAPAAARSGPRPAATYREYTQSAPVWQDGGIVFPPGPRG